MPIAGKIRSLFLICYVLNLMSAPLIQALISHLPRHAEEEGDFYPVPREALVDSLCRQEPLNRAVAENTVALIESLLDTLAVLDRVYLQKGEWCFVSFPAQLLALSLLTAWGESDSRFFDGRFWNTQGIADDRKERQREVLHAIESRRVAHPANGAAKPIRYIYVAWGVIKIAGKVLFYQREDTQKRHDKTAGDYGLVGGRLNQNDVSREWPITDLLKALQAENSVIAKEALPETLKRELREETGLEFDRHYQFSYWRSLRPFQQLQGAAPNHALTGYHFDIFHIQLTLDGYLFLLEQVKRDERLVWFTVAEMAAGATVDGKIAYLKALLADFDDDRGALQVALTALPDSFAAGYLFAPEKYGVSLRRDEAGPAVWAGVLGKEKPLASALTERQFSILLGLAAHLRGFDWERVEDHLVFHPHGWVDAGQHHSLPRELEALAGLLLDCGLPIESHSDRLFRWSLDPGVVYFDDAWFLIRLNQGDLEGVNIKIPARIERQTFNTAFGVVKAKTGGFMMTLDFADNLRKLACGHYASDNVEAVKIEDAYKKGLHKNAAFSALGLKSLIRREAGFIKLAIRLDIMPSAPLP